MRTIVWTDQTCPEQQRSEVRIYPPPPLMCRDAAATTELRHDGDEAGRKGSYPALDTNTEYTLIPAEE